MRLEIALPLPEKHVCSICHPEGDNQPRRSRAKGIFTDHNRLKYHLKETHEKDVELVFGCRCGQHFHSLKTGNIHLRSCQGAAPEERQGTPQPPADRTAPSTNRPRPRSEPTRHCQRQPGPPPRATETASTQTDPAPPVNEPDRQTRQQETPDQAQQSHFCDVFNTVESAAALDNAILAYSASLCRQRTPQRTNRDNRPTRNPQHEAARQIQQLYRQDPKKAMSQIRGEAAATCSIPVAALHEHFHNVHSMERQPVGAMPAEVPTLPPPDTDDPLSASLDSKFVAKCLAETSNTFLPDTLLFT